MRIDIHTHFFPHEYLAELKRLDISMEQRLDARFTSLEARTKDMKRCGIDKQVLSITVPGVDVTTPEDSVRLAKIVNDALAHTVEGSDRFLALASLPMTSPGDALDELDRAINTLGLKGAGIYSNVNGKPLDMPEFWPIYEKAARMRVPVFIHPAAPAHREIFQDYGLISVLGFPFDTTLAATRLALSGLMERYQDLMIVLAHVGGVLPFILGRIDDGHRMFPVARKNISRPPSEYLKAMNLDTVSFYEPALTCAYKSWDSGKLLLGSDYPYDWVGDLERCITNIESLHLNDSEKEKIMHGNAEQLLRIES